MTSFLDGPAKGQSLSLKRSPVFLRVVCKVAPESGKLGPWDALDGPDEVILVYRLAQNHGACHVHQSGGRGGFYPISTYALSPHQPSDHILRDVNQWQKWCLALNQVESQIQNVSVEHSSPPPTHP